LRARSKFPRDRARPVIAALLWPWLKKPPLFHPSGGYHPPAQF
jgi:hypothetical protein